MNKNCKIVLASASPRRKQLLEQLGWQVLCHPVDIDETPNTNEPAPRYCERMALEKAERAMESIETQLPIVTADTTVVFQGEILGKPENESAALAMLNKLSAQQHQVFTAVTVTYQGSVLSALNQNTVKFTKINEAQIRAYVATGEPMDKAGSYGIQGMAAMWVEQIQGSYSGIMGLPLFETSQLIKKLDIITPLAVLP